MALEQSVLLPGLRGAADGSELALRDSISQERTIGGVRYVLAYTTAGVDVAVRGGRFQG